MRSSGKIPIAPIDWFHCTALHGDDCVGVMVRMIIGDGKASAVAVATTSFTNALTSTPKLLD